MLDKSLVVEAFALSQELFLRWDGGSFEDRIYRLFSRAARRAMRRQDARDAQIAAKVRTR